MLSHGQTVHFRPHSVIHQQKAEHQSIPKIRLKVNFRHPMKRQIFGDTSGQDPNLHLALCHNEKIVGFYPFVCLPKKKVDIKAGRSLTQMEAGRSTDGS